jgi:hypothetical protein
LSQKPAYTRILLKLSGEGVGDTVPRSAGAGAGAKGFATAKAGK